MGVQVLIPKRGTKILFFWLFFEVEGREDGVFPQSFNWPMMALVRGRATFDRAAAVKILTRLWEGSLTTSISSQRFKGHSFQELLMSSILLPGTDVADSCTAIASNTESSRKSLAVTNTSEVDSTAILLVPLVLKVDPGLDSMDIKDGVNGITLRIRGVARLRSHSTVFPTLDFPQSWGTPSLSQQLLMFFLRHR